MTESDKKTPVRGWKKWMAALALSIAAVTVGGAAFQLLASLRPALPKRDAVERVFNVEVWDVQAQDIQEIVRGFGTAHAHREVTLSAEVSGIIREVHPQLEVGVSVRGLEQAAERADSSGLSSSQSIDLSEATDLLLRIDDSRYKERQQQALDQMARDESQLTELHQNHASNVKLMEKAEADLKTFREEFDRQKNLHDQGVINDAEMNRSRLELRRYEVALLQLQNEDELYPVRQQQIERLHAVHEADYRLANLDLSRTEVRPPFDGVLSQVFVELGQYVRPGERLVHLIDISAVEVPVSIALSDFAKIDTSLQSRGEAVVRLAVNETAPARWSGKVRRADPVVDELTRTVQLFVEVENRRSDPTAALRPGTFVQARIDGPVHRQALAIPRDALIDGDIFVVVGDRVERRKAGIVRTIESLVILDAGVESGEQVVLTNLDVLRPGSRVEIQTRRSKDDLE